MSLAARVVLVAASVILLAGSAACGSGTPSEPGGPGKASSAAAETASAGGTPLPAGQPAEVDAWRTVQTWLVDQRPVFEPGEVQGANVWRVTLMRAASCSPATGAPPAPPPEPPAPPGEPPAPPGEPPAPPGEPTPTAERSPTPGVPSSTGATHYCVLLVIENPAASPGLLDLNRDGPVLVTPDGTRLPVAGVRRERDPFAMAASAGRVTSASVCSFSAPDAQGRQAADCATMLVARSNGTTFEEVLAMVGAGKDIELELAFQAPGATNDAVLEWPGGVRFAAEPSAIDASAPSAEASRPPTPAPPPAPPPIPSPLLPVTPIPTSTMPAAGPGSASFSGSGTAQTEMRDLAGGDYTMTVDLRVPSGQYNCVAMVCLTNPTADIGGGVWCAVESVTDDEGGHKTVTQELPGLEPGPYFVKARAEDPSQACEWTMTMRPR
jgi:hypothetical protein